MCCESFSAVLCVPFRRDDPAKRRPDISVAKRELKWQPAVPVRDGLQKTIDYFRRELEETGETRPRRTRADSQEHRN